MAHADNQRPLVRRSERIAFDLLDLINTEPGLSQRKIAEHLDISLGRDNLALRLLHQKALLDRPNASEARQGDTYVLTAKGLAERALLGEKVLPVKLAELHRLQMQIQRLVSDARGL